MTANSFTDEQIREYREAFNLFDKDGDETISTPELLTVMRSLGHNPSNDDIMDMIKEVDKNGNGKIEFNEFLILMEKKLKTFESEELIREAFDVMDHDGDGYITVSKLRHVVQELGLNLSEEEMDEMILEADPSGDGRVSYQEFVDIMTMR